MASLFFRVPVEQIGYVRAIVEAYDGLAIVRAPDANRGEVEWIVGDGQEAEAAALALRLQTEAHLQPITRPDDWPR